MRMGGNRQNTARGDQPRGDVSFGAGLCRLSLRPQPQRTVAMLRLALLPAVLLLAACDPQAAIDHGGVNTVGLCHGVQNGHRQIATALGVPMDEVDIVCSGINHQHDFMRCSCINLLHHTLYFFELFHQIALVV